MKFLTFSLGLMLTTSAFAAGSGRPDVYTSSVLKTKSEVTFDQAKQAFEALNPVLLKIKGYEKRNLFFDKEQNLWIDQIKWKHVDAAKGGLSILYKDPAYGKLEKILDATASKTKYEAERVGEYDGKK